MLRVFVTGSADGLGKMAAGLLIEQGHQVVLHARSAARADETRRAVTGAEDVVVGDLSSIAETRSVADQVNKLGRFDAVIHNAGIGYRESKLEKTVDGLPRLFAVNTLGPYILTALITMPKRLVYLASGMHYGAGSHLDDMLWEKRLWNGSQAYAEIKFQDVLLAFAVARLFPEVKSNALEPGWVPTKMGGAGAPDDLDKGHRTQVWLATSDESAATVSGQYFFHQKPRDPDSTTRDIHRQGRLLELCARFQVRRFPNRILFRIPLGYANCRLTALRQKRPSIRPRRSRLGLSARRSGERPARRRQIGARNRRLVSVVFGLSPLLPEPPPELAGILAACRGVTLPELTPKPGSGIK